MSCFLASFAAAPFAAVAGVQAAEIAIISSASGLIIGSGAAAS
jgi:hypothetical protein